MICDEKTGEFIAMSTDEKYVEVKEEPIKEEPTEDKKNKDPKRSFRKQPTGRMVCDEVTGEFVKMTADTRFIEVKEEPIIEETIKVEKKKDSKRAFKK